VADTEPARDLPQSQTGLHYCNTRQSSLIFCHACGRFVLRWAYTLRRAPWWWMDFCHEQCQNML